MKLKDLNPFASAPTVADLIAEELAELERLQYLEDKRADHHRAQAEEIQRRITKLRGQQWAAGPVTPSGAPTMPPPAPAPVAMPGPAFSWDFPEYGRSPNRPAGL